ncbi:MAG: hypothetical protein AVDCRST_MAG25-3255, partial [uncultured Rubrobacteraceae bacterium]
GAQRPRHGHHTGHRRARRGPHADVRRVPTVLRAALRSRGSAPL